MNTNIRKPVVTATFTEDDQPFVGWADKTRTALENCNPKSGNSSKTK